MNIQNANNSFITENKNRIVFLFLLFVLSSLRMFGQTAPVQEVIVNKVQTEFFSPTIQDAVASTDAQIDFVGWFMGSRQSQMNENESSNNSRSTVTKKQILTSGITPNKVLYRTFMKRVLSQDSAIA